MDNPGLRRLPLFLFLPSFPSRPRTFGGSKNHLGPRVQDLPTSRSGRRREDGPPGEEGPRAGGRREPPGTPSGGTGTTTAPSGRGPGVGGRGAAVPRATGRRTSPPRPGPVVEGPPHAAVSSVVSVRRPSGASGSRGPFDVAGGVCASRRPSVGDLSASSRAQSPGATGVEGGVDGSGSGV